MCATARACGRMMGSVLGTPRKAYYFIVHTPAGCELTSATPNQTANNQTARETRWKNRGILIANAQRACAQIIEQFRIERARGAARWFYDTTYMCVRLHSNACARPFKTIKRQFTITCEFSVHGCVPAPVRDTHTRTDTRVLLITTAHVLGGDGVVRWDR